jgi:hypothetical protein
MTFCAEDAARFLHQACRALPHRCSGKAPAPPIASETAPLAQAMDKDKTGKDDRFYVTVLEHALAFFGSRILYPARRALRDADIADLFDVTREDLEHQTSLRFADAVEVLDYLTSQRGSDGCALQSLAPAPDFTGRKYDYAAEQLGYLAGNDLYDAYLAGRLSTAALRKLFLTHIERPGVARETYVRLRVRLRSGKHAGERTL